MRSPGDPWRGPTGASTAILALALFGATAALAAPSSLHLIDEVNSKNVGWTAGRNANFDSWTDEDLKASMGVRFLGQDSTLPTKTYTQEEIDAAPTEFDARKQWPGCIGAIRDQARCGSCWAFGASESISDRACISGHFSKFTQLAPLDLVACDNGWCVPRARHHGRLSCATR